MNARLPIEPLRAWIEERLQRTSSAELAECLGVAERRLFAWRFENAVVRRAVLEEALHRIGLGLWEIYPEEQLAAVSGSVAERFWRFVPERPEDPGACWPWWGALGSTPPRTPVFWLDGRSVSALRLAYPGDPGGRRVHRTCGTLRCVRPSHLNVRSDPGAPAERGTWGEANGAAKLTDEQVVNLRLLHERGVSQRALARHYGLASASVYEIVYGVNRVAAGGPIKPKRGAVAA